MSGLISVCIPTYQRPGLLGEAIASCFIQDYRPLEIVIGDDSRNDESERLVAGLSVPEGIGLRYRRHSPSLGQSANVNSLFARAAGERLVLLHDDDLLCADALVRLDAGWRAVAGTSCIYGKQYVISADGATLADETDALNAYYFRSEAYAGRQASGLQAALRQQMPNNGYLIDTALARDVGYRAEAEIGQSVDADFAVRAGLAVGDGCFVLLDAFTSKYRLTPGSIMRSRSLNHGQHLLYAELLKLPVSAVEAEAKEIMLRRVALDASLDAATAGERRTALRIMMSGYYDRPFWSRWTMLRLLCVVSPRLGEAVGRVLRGG